MQGLYISKSLDGVLDTSEGALPFRLQRIAEDELGETPTRRKEALEKLEKLILEEPDFYPRKDKDFLLRFLRVRKYNVDAAMQNLRNYYSYRAACKSVYSDFLPSTIPPEARRVIMPMPGRDVHGRPIFWVTLSAWRPDDVSHTLLHRAGLLVAEHINSDPTVQTLGISVLMDFHELSMGHALALNVGLLKKMLEYIQVCSPARMKAFHVVREGPAFHVLYAILKPFLKRKLASRLHFHGYNFEGLHKEISPGVLPEELGGTAQPLDYDAFWQQMDQLENLFETTNRYGYAHKLLDDFAPQEEIEESLEFF